MHHSEFPFYSIRTVLLCQLHCTLFLAYCVDCTVLSFYRTVSVALYSLSIVLCRLHCTLFLSYFIGCTVLPFYCAVSVAVYSLSIVLRKCPFFKNALAHIPALPWHGERILEGIAAASYCYCLMLLPHPIASASYCYLIIMLLPQIATSLYCCCRNC